LLLPIALAAWWRCPNHLWIKPYRQRSTLLQAVIVRRPILGLVLRRGPTAHPNQLSRWIQTVNPISIFMQQSLCNRKHLILKIDFYLFSQLAKQDVKSCFRKKDTEEYDPRHLSTLLSKLHLAVKHCLVLSCYFVANRVAHR